MSDHVALNYFLVCPPELVSLAQSELKHKAGDLVQKISPQNAGVSFQAGPEAVQLNAWLKIPTRILAEVTRFKARDLPRLYKKARALAWHREFFAFEGLPTWKISAKRSRLIHTKKIEQTLNEAFSDAVSSQPARRAPKNRHALAPTFFVHLEDDELTLSVDTSGDPLYKRGLKKASVPGPLRENLASACLMWMFEQLKLDASTQVELIDPMAGSGSFALEALSLRHSTLKTRNFSYQQLPRFQNLKKWEILDPKAPDVQSVMANDLSAKGLKQNLQSFPQVQVLEGDAFELDFSPKGPDLCRLVVCNPPYGERIAKNFTLPKLIQLMQGPLAAEGIGLLAPRSWDLQAIANSQGLQLLKALDFKNGGLSTRFWVLKA